MYNSRVHIRNEGCGLRLVHGELAVWRLGATGSAALVLAKQLYNTKLFSSVYILFYVLPIRQNLASVASEGSRSTYTA